MKSINRIGFGAALVAATLGVGCGNDTATGPLGDVDSLVILQRPKRNDTGDIFQYTSYIPGAKLVKLSPPTADGKLTVLCCDKAGAEFANIDISGYDISFDAKEIVFAGKLDANSRYGLFILTLDTGNVEQLATDPGRDYVNPIFLPGDKILFTTNAVVEAGAPQHRDEYERGVTLQMGTINNDGSGETLGPRNLSHRTFPTLVSDGRIMFTQWDHLGPVNAGHLMFMNTDMTDLREAFGKEGTGAANSTLKAQEISPGRFVAIATSRDRTIQSGALIDVRLGMSSTKDGVLRADTAMSEANASYVMLTPDVPVDRVPSSSTVGRYYDAYPLNAKESPDLLVSWADGPVESSVLDAAGVSANFGVYLYDPTHLSRHPILDNPDMWDIFARPLRARTAPPATGSSIDNTLGGQSLIGSMNVYDSSLASFVQGAVYGVRIMEGFSSEEGFPEDFGTTMFEGQANLGVARVAQDGSWLAKVPANVPLHLQAVDNFGMSLENEPVWFSTRAGESRVCGGCHEDRAKTTIINPGVTDAFNIGPTDAKGGVSRYQRIMATSDFANPDLIQSNGDGAEKLVGMGWSNVVQPVFDTNCTNCHDASNTAGLAGYKIVDAQGQTVLEWTFNLSNTPVSVNYGMGMMDNYTASYFSLAGPDMEALEKNNLTVVGNFKTYINPQDSRNSDLIKKINPTKLFPQPDTNVRAFATTPHSSVGYKAGRELTPTEFYKLILAVDMGGSYYARENNPMVTDYK